jgi:Ca2+-binding EF-hand superfamily protein
LRRNYTKSSVLGKDFCLDESADAPPVAKQIGVALRANSARVLDFLRELDTDGNGNVDRQEFRQAMCDLGLGVTRTDMDKIFDDWDADKSGDISFEELKRALCLVKPSTSPTPLLSQKTSPRLKAQYTKSSVLGKDFCLDESADAPPIPQQIANALRANAAKVLDFFRELDTSNDGVVSRAEFKRAMARLQLETSTTELDELFDVWDVNSNGTIELEELKKILTTRRPTSRPVATPMSRSGARGGTGSRASPSPPSRQSPSLSLSPPLTADVGTESRVSGERPAPAEHQAASGQPNQ